jgi:hypothetical protein
LKSILRKIIQICRSDIGVGNNKVVIIFICDVKNIAKIVQQKLSVIIEMYLSDASGSIVYVGR